ncbi:MAG: hypothetical protein FWE61_06810 [Micrococcales bacterium]|nr:hypothetical protein [Micrococcales bacterium]
MGAARAAVIRCATTSTLTVTGYLDPHRVFWALLAWQRATAVAGPEPSYCGYWECCGYCCPTAQSRDILDELLHKMPPGPGRELRRLVRQADTRIAGDEGGTWWRDPLRWR